MAGVLSPKMFVFASVVNRARLAAISALGTVAACAASKDAATAAAWAAACSVWLAAALSHNGSKPFQILGSKPLAYIAEISYALYIIHPVTVQGWFDSGSTFDRYLFKRPISFILTFVAAHLATFYWEQIWTKSARNWIKRRREAYGLCIDDQVAKTLI